MGGRPWGFEKRQAAKSRTSPVISFSVESPREKTDHACLFSHQKTFYTDPLVAGWRDIIFSPSQGEDKWNDVFLVCSEKCKWRKHHIHCHLLSPSMVPAYCNISCHIFSVSVLPFAIWSFLPLATHHLLSFTPTNCPKIYFLLPWHCAPHSFLCSDLAGRKSWKKKLNHINTLSALRNSICPACVLWNAVCCGFNWNSSSRGFVIGCTYLPVLLHKNFTSFWFPSVKEKILHPVSIMFSCTEELCSLVMI